MNKEEWERIKALKVKPRYRHISTSSVPGRSGITYKKKKKVQAEGAVEQKKVM